MTYRHFNSETTRSSVLKAVADTENEAAWSRFFDLYAGFVFSIARSKGLKEEDADDVVQVVFTDLARTLPTFKYDRAKGKFRSYLIGLVHWRVKDRLRLVKRDKLVLRDDKQMKVYMDEAATMPSADKEFAEREWQSAALEEALRRIKPDVRPEHYAAFYASAVEGQDTETVLRLYNLSRDNLYQIRKRLTIRLKPIITAVLAEMDDGRFPHADGEDPR